MKRSKTLKVDGDEFLKPLVRVEDFDRLLISQPVTLVNGCFDILHASHMYLLHQARNLNLNGTVIVALDSDELVASHKPGRPIMNFIERWQTISYMPIDIVVEIGSDKQFLALVDACKPDFRVRGEEYKGKPSRINNIRNIFIPNLSGLSTTEIINRAKAASSGVCI